MQKQLVQVQTGRPGRASLMNSRSSVERSRLFFIFFLITPFWHHTLSVQHAYCMWRDEYERSSTCEKYQTLSTPSLNTALGTCSLLCIGIGYLLQIYPSTHRTAGIRCVCLVFSLVFSVPSLEPPRVCLPKQFQDLFRAGIHCNAVSEEKGRDGARSRAAVVRTFRDSAQDA
eukprot:1055045-Rhodomonas_salina.7